MYRPATEIENVPVTIYRGDWECRLLCSGRVAEYRSGNISGPVEACYPSEGGTAEDVRVRLQLLDHRGRVRFEREYAEGEFERRFGAEVLGEVYAAIERETDDCRDDREDWDDPRDWW